MELLVSVAAFVHDVDHIPGARVSFDKVRVKEKTYTDFTKWKQHAERINSTNYNDRLGISNGVRFEIYADDDEENPKATGKIVARWDKAKKTGIVYES